MPAMDITQPFRGSHAVAAGLLTRAMLRGPRFRRLFPDVHVPADAEVDLELLSRAAYLRSPHRTGDQRRAQPRHAHG